MKPNKDQHDYIEKVGRWWEAAAGSRAGGRILGWLMICDPPHQSSADLIEALDLSAGSISNQLRFLEGLGLLERVTFPGDRVSYFQMRPHAWVEVMIEKQAGTAALVALAESAQGVLPSDRPDRVTELARVAEFMNKEWPALMDRLKEHLIEERA
ncbi:MAG: ArsR family transcriptional regulator [Actinomycetota bacterium]|nr:ArsR family transcriptional regulator [Actinomycetota bacterium]